MPANAPHDELCVHGTCVAIAGRAALLRGAPGSGKSDLALRFISAFGHDPEAEGAARLVSDDQVLISKGGDTLIVRAPEAIAGQLEVRGIGIVAMDHRNGAQLSLIVDLVDADEVPRMPPEPPPQEEVLGMPVPVLRLDPREASCPVKLKLALTGGV